jgi:hypothetical protein
MTALSVESIQKTAMSVSTYESFGRSLVEALLRTAAEHVDKKQNVSAAGDNVTFSIDVSISSIPDSQCFLICLPRSSCIRVCTHELV